MTLPAFLCALSALVQFIMAVAVMVKSARKTENRLFSLLLLLFMIWNIAEMRLIFSGISAAAVKLLFTPGFLLAYFFCLFTAVYPEPQPDAAIIKKLSNTVFLAFPALIMVYLLWNNFLINEFESIAGGFSLKFGRFEFLLKGVLIGYLALSLRTLSNSRQKAETQIQVRRLRYTFTAMLLPVAAGSIIIAFSRWFIGGVTIYPFGLFPVLSILMSLILGYTMLKYNLMEIDLVFSIGLVYTFLTMILAGVMELMQELMQEILSVSNVWSKIFSVLVIAAIFSPLKELLINLVNRFFGRQSFDSALVMQTILGELRRQPDQTKLFRRLLEELNLVLEFSSAAVLSHELISQPDNLKLNVSKDFLQLIPEDLSDIETIIHHFSSLNNVETSHFFAELKTSGICHVFSLRSNQIYHGSLLIGAKNTRVPYSITELNLLCGIAREVPHIIENLQMINQLLSREKAAQELQWASRMLQVISTTSTSDQFANLQLACYSSLSEAIKGDMLDICDRPENSFIGIYDAFHQGIPAVLTLNILFAVFRCFKETDSKLEMAHNALRNFKQDLSAAVTLLSTDDNNLEIFNCANPLPILITTGKAEFLKAENSTPVGTGDRLVTGSVAIKLEKDQLLLISTNGLFKAVKQLKGDELMNILNGNTFANVVECREYILKIIEPFTRSSYSDDITFIVAGLKNEQT